jgi:excisionase family DNA binding protein
MSGQGQSEKLLTVSEVAEILRVDPTTCRRWIKNEILEAVHLPRAGKRESYRIRRATIDTLLATGSLAVALS